MSKAMDKVVAPIAQALREELAVYEATGKFKMPFKIDFPYNAKTQMEYGGVNIFRLALEGRSVAVWGTFNQWNALGYKVKKGSKGTAIYTPPLFSKIKDPNTNETSRMERPPMAVYVFNGEDVEHAENGNALDVSRINKDHQNIDHAEYFAQFGFDLKQGDAASYRLKSDCITMPGFDRFLSNDAYYSTLAHELIHWTGHPSRLDRPTITERNDFNYAVEELTAEFGAALICAHLGIVNDDMKADHLEYLASWASAIKKDDAAIEMALINASHAYRYITQLIKEQRPEQLVEAV